MVGLGAPTVMFSSSSDRWEASLVCCIGLFIVY